MKRNLFNSIIAILTSIFGAIVPNRCRHCKKLLWFWVFKNLSKQFHVQCYIDHLNKEFQTNIAMAMYITLLKSKQKEVSELERMYHL